MTGASSGIGRATALRLANEGYHVFTADVHGADGDVPAPAGQGRLTHARMDVTDPAGIAVVAGEVSAHVGQAGLTALVNNAGIGTAYPLELIPLERFRSTFAVNVDGLLAVTQAMLPLIRQASGHIVNMGSVGGRITMPFAGALTASKYAVRSVTDALRLELAPWGIRVVLIEPATIHTEAVGKLERDAAKALGQFGSEGQRLYASIFEAMTRKAVARESGGSSPDLVAELIARVIANPRPKTHYLVGKDSHLLAMVAALPAPILDAMRRKLFALPDPGSFRQPHNP